MKLLYPAIFTPADEGGYTVEFPDLPGCFTEGDDLIEAIEMAADAASGWILGEIEEGREYPRASSISDIAVSSDGIANLVVLDMDSYAEKYGTKAVRRNITIPAWLDTYVQKNNLSLSRVVQDNLYTIAMK